MRAQRGFTLFELVITIIIVGVLAAIAVPKFLSVATSARIASLNTMAGVLRSTSENLRAVCKLDPSCDYGSFGQNIVIGGKNADVVFGWLDAGDCLHCSQIDDWVTYNGFTPVLVPTNRTRFTLDGSPDPTNCSVTYVDPFAYYDMKLHIEMATSGC